MLTLSAGPMLIGNLPNEPLNEHGSGRQMPWMAAEHGRPTVDELVHEDIVFDSLSLYAGV